MSPEERDLYLHVLKARAAQALVDAPVEAARAVVRARLAREQTAPFSGPTPVTTDNVREMAREVFGPPTPPWSCPSCDGPKPHVHVARFEDNGINTHEWIETVYVE
jgi:hypothetical protein